jgi:hypothetical protein
MVYQNKNMYLKEYYITLILVFLISFNSHLTTKVHKGCHKGAQRFKFRFLCVHSCSSLFSFVIKNILFFKYGYFGDERKMS